MNIENEIFKRANVNFSNLEKYGFKKEKQWIWINSISRECKKNSLFSWYNVSEVYHG